MTLASHLLSHKANSKTSSADTTTAQLTPKEPPNVGTTKKPANTNVAKRLQPSEVWSVTQQDNPIPLTKDEQTSPKDSFRGSTTTYLRQTSKHSQPSHPDDTTRAHSETTTPSRVGEATPTARARRQLTLPSPTSLPATVTHADSRQTDRPNAGATTDSDHSTFQQTTTSPTSASASHTDTNEPAH